VELLEHLPTFTKNYCIAFWAARYHFKKPAFLVV
jgi:hypothetical protein